MQVFDSTACLIPAEEQDPRLCFNSSRGPQRAISLQLQTVGFVGLALNRKQEHTAQVDPLLATGKGAFDAVSEI